MADVKLTALDELTTGNVADGDKLYIVDVSDTTDSADGTSKHVLVSSLSAKIESDIEIPVVPDERVRIAVTDTASVASGDPVELTAISLDVDADNANVYDITETLTGDLLVALSVTGLVSGDAGRLVYVRRSGANGVYTCTVGGLEGEQTVALIDGRSAAFMFDGTNWQHLFLLSNFEADNIPYSVEAVTASANLTDARRFHGANGKQLLVEPVTGSDNIVLTLPDDAAVGSWFIRRSATSTGTITIVNESAGSINGTTGATVTLANTPYASVLVEVIKQPGTATEATATGDLTASTINYGSHDFNDQVIFGQRNKKYSLTGDQTLNAATVEAGSTVVHTGTAATWTVPSRVQDGSEAMSIVIRNRGSGAITLSASGVTIKGGTTVDVDGSATIEWEYDGSSVEYAWVNAT